MYNMVTVGPELEMTKVDHIPVTSWRRKRDFSIVVVSIVSQNGLSKFLGIL